jgi:TonB family protein
MNLILDSAIKATPILAAAWIATFVLRRASAPIRHTIWLFAMLAMALTPAVLSIPAAAIPRMTLLAVSSSVAATPQVTSRQLPWMLGIWAAGAMVVLARFIAGVFATIRITRSAAPIDGILYSESAATPMTWGFIRPVVILPSYAAAWPAKDRDLVIRHELAHIERQDWLWQTFSSIVTAVFWFHPLAWVAKIRLSREAEEAADDLVLAGGGSPADYAARLVDVARRLHGISAPATAIPMVRRPELEARVRSILDSSQRRAMPGILLRCAIAFTAVMMLVPVAVTRQAVYAQTAAQKITKDMTPPKIVHKVEPAYTEEAKAAGLEGTVGLQIEITAKGSTTNIQVLKSLGMGLDETAVQAVSKWRFKPAQKDGQPVAVIAHIEVNFHLK